MPRTARKAPGRMVFHCINRRVGRHQLFQKAEDYAAFERVMAYALKALPVRLLSYCLMPNHWHLMLWLSRDGQLGAFIQCLTLTHTRQHQEHCHEVGHGHLYQGRYKSFPVQEDRHFLVVTRYVERNALRAKLVGRAEHWMWGSLWRREQGAGRGSSPGSAPEVGSRCDLPLTAWPVAMPADYLQWVNEPQTAAEEEAVRMSVTRGRPFGDPAWQARTTKRLGLESAFRPNGRPRKTKPGKKPEVRRE